MDCRWTLDRPCRPGAGRTIEYRRQVTTNQTQVTCDNGGYPIDPAQWDESIALTLAADEGIELEAAYWPVLRCMHDWRTERRVAPDVRHRAMRSQAERALSSSDKKTILELMDAAAARAAGPVPSESQLREGQA